MKIFTNSYEHLPIAMLTELKLLRAAFQCLKNTLQGKLFHQDKNTRPLHYLFIKGYKRGKIQTSQKSSHLLIGYNNVQIIQKLFQLALTMLLEGHKHGFTVRAWSLFQHKFTLIKGSPFHFSNTIFPAQRDSHSVGNKGIPHIKYLPCSQRVIFIFL